MKANSFEDLQAWQKAKMLTEYIYADHRGCRDLGFRDQIQRASISVMNNIAEGFERNTDKELVAFLYFAKGSAGEVRSMLYMARSFNYVDEEVFQRDYECACEVSRLLSGLIKSRST